MDALIFKTRKAAEAYTLTVDGWIVGFGTTECYKLPGLRKWVVRCYGRDTWVLMGIEGRTVHLTDAELLLLGR